MKQINRNLGTLLMTMVAVSVLAGGSASARGIDSGHTDSTTPVTATTSTSTDSNVQTDTSSSASHSSTTSVTTATTASKTEMENHVEAGRALSAENEVEAKDATDTSVEHRIENLHSKAKNMLAVERADKKSATKVEDRQKACTAREANLNNKIANYNKQAARTLASYNAAFAKLEAFQADHKVSAATYASLVADATAKQAAAKAAVDALAKVSVKVDCTAADPAATVAIVKTAVNDTKTALKNYRAAIKAVLVALMTAKSDNIKASADSSQTTTTGGSN